MLTVNSRPPRATPNPKIISIIAHDSAPIVNVTTDSLIRSRNFQSYVN